MILIDCTLSLMSAYGTYFLINNLRINAVRSSALLSLVGYITLLFLSYLYPLEVNYYASLIFGASFVGMCSYKKVALKVVLLASLVFVLLYIQLIPYLSEFGGALGFSAFFAVLLSWKWGVLLRGLRT